MSIPTPEEFKQYADARKDIEHYKNLMQMKIFLKIIEETLCIGQTSVYSHCCYSDAVKKLVSEHMSKRGWTSTWEDNCFTCVPTAS